MSATTSAAQLAMGQVSYGNCGSAQLQLRHQRSAFAWMHAGGVFPRAWICSRRANVVDATALGKILAKQPCHLANSHRPLCSHTIPHRAPASKRSPP